MIAGIRAGTAINLAGSLVAIGLVSILAFMTWALVYVSIPTQNKDALGLLIGVLSSNVALVVGFFFGSSANARQQQATIDTLAKTAQTAGTALAGAAGAAPGDVSLKPGDQVTVAATDSPSDEGVTR